MNFINCLKIDLKNVELNEKLQEKILLLEEKLLKNENLELDISEKNIIIYNKKYIDNDKISFIDYMEEWKILKDFLIENNLANTENYKIFFKMQKINIWEDAKNVDLNEFIAEVPKDDKKVLEVLDFLKQIKK